MEMITISVSCKFKAEDKLHPWKKYCQENSQSLSLNRIRSMVMYFVYFFFYFKYSQIVKSFSLLLKDRVSNFSSWRALFFLVGLRLEFFILQNCISGIWRTIKCSNSLKSIDLFIC